MKFPTKRRMARLISAAMLGLSMGQVAVADDFSDVRSRWVDRWSGGPLVQNNLSDPDLKKTLDAADTAAKKQADSMDTNPAPGQIYLWNDLQIVDVYNDKNQLVTGMEKVMSDTFTRLQIMSVAYATPSSLYYHNAALGAKIKFGLKWLVTNFYKATNPDGTPFPEHGNWWHWQIGSPKPLVGAAINIYDLWGVDANGNSELAPIFASIDRYIPDPGLKTAANGVGFVYDKVIDDDKEEHLANLADKCLAVILRGALGNSDTHIKTARDRLAGLYQFTTEGDGFRADGSYIQHGAVPYTGTYGVVTASNVAYINNLLAGTAWEPDPASTPGVENVRTWLPDFYAPFMWNGAMMDMQSGRAVSRQGGTDHGNGRDAMKAFAVLADSMPAAEQAQIKSAIKGVISRDQFHANYFSSGSAFEVAKLKAIATDPGVVPTPEIPKTAVYPGMDRALLRTPNFAIGIAMSSMDRMDAWEQGLGENLKNWWSGLGMTYLYNGDQFHYDNNFWPTVNYLRLPGTTTDHSSKQAADTDWPHTQNQSRMVGGANLGGQASVVAMALNTGTLKPLITDPLTQADLDTNKANKAYNKTLVTASQLTANKAWFLFGDKVVAVGNSIASGDANNTGVETIVENRRIGMDGLETLTMNGQQKASMVPWTETVPGTTWAHLSSPIAGADIGYYFPDAPAVTALREQRTGKWTDIKIANTDNTDKYNNFVSLAIDHGAKPTAGSYSYVLLPNRSAQQTANYAANPTIQVMTNSKFITAVRDKELGLTGAVIWSDSATGRTLNNACGSKLITSDHSSAVLLQRTGRTLDVSVSDPTQKYNGIITVELGYEALPSGHVLDPNITITQTSPTTKLAIDVTGALGKSAVAKIQLAPTVTLSPTDDTYVRGGDYANYFYGSATTLPVKQPAPTVSDNFLRKGLMKFDLSCVEGDIDSATLNLGVAASSQQGTVTHLARAVAGNWAQGTVNYATMPAPGAQLASWTTPAAGNMVQVDMTNAASSAKAGNGLLAFDIEAAADYGNGTVDYASKENATTTLRPTLTVNLR